MLNYIWAFMMCASVIYAAFNGNIGEVSQAVLDGSAQAITLAISMAGVVALWSGLMEIADKAGVVRFLTKLLSPIVNWLFPSLNCEEGKKAKEYITVNFVMNMLGTGWSATGPGLQAMEELSKCKRDPGSAMASKEMCTFLVINISSLQLIPVNIIAYRRSYGAVNPEEIVLPALCATLISSIVAIIVCKIMCYFSKN